MQIHITQQYADRTTLWGAFLVRTRFPIFQNACFQPAPDQADQTRVSYPMLDKAEHPFVAQAPEVVLEVRFQHPFHFPAGNYFVQCCQRLMGTPPRPSTKRARQKVLLINGGELPARRFSGAPGRLHKAHPTGVSLAFRVSEYTRAGWPALGIPGGGRIAAWLQSIPRSSSSPPARSVHPPQGPSRSGSDIDSPKLFPW